MSTELTLRRDYLSQHRRMIIGRSIAASMAGMVPIPVFEEWLSSAIRCGTLRRIALARDVDLEDNAIKRVANGNTPPPQWSEMALGTLAYKIVSRTWRKLIYAYVATKRTQAAAKNFAIATMFDHYCTRLHIGMGLEGEAGGDLRTLMEEALKLTPGGLGEQVFRNGALAAAKATVQAPMELLDVATGGAVRRLLKRKDDEITAVEEVDQALDAQLREQSSFLARAATAVELKLSADANPYLDDLIENFDTLWREADRARQS